MALSISRGQAAPAHECCGSPFRAAREGWTQNPDRCLVFASGFRVRSLNLAPRNDRFSPPPELRQRSLLAEHRIASGQRHLRNHRQRLVAVGRVIATTEIVCSLGRVGADDEKIIATGQSLWPVPAG